MSGSKAAEVWGSPVGMPGRQLPGGPWAQQRRGSMLARLGEWSRPRSMGARQQAGGPGLLLPDAPAKPQVANGEMGAGNTRAAMLCHPTCLRQHADADNLLATHWPQPSRCRLQMVCLPPLAPHRHARQGLCRQHRSLPGVPPLWQLKHCVQARSSDPGPRAHIQHGTLPG